MQKFDKYPLEYINEIMNELDIKKKFRLINDESFLPFETMNGIEE